jgi:hypothetical protein
MRNYVIASSSFLSRRPAETPGFLNLLFVRRLSLGGRCNPALIGESRRTTSHVKNAESAFKFRHFYAVFGNLSLVTIASKNHLKGIRVDREDAGVCEVCSHVERHRAQALFF